MITARQAAKQRRALERELERDQRRAARKKLAQMREYLRAARAHRRVRIAEIRAQCRELRATRRERVKALRLELRAQERAALAAIRVGERTTCKLRSAEARKSAEVAAAAAALLAEKQHQATLRRYQGVATLERSPRGRTRRGAESIHESDAEVLANIPQDLRTVWNAVKSRIRETARRTRTETFLEWVQEHSGEVLAIQDRQFAADVTRIEAQERALAREIKRGRGSAPAPVVATYWLTLRGRGTGPNEMIESVHGTARSAKRAEPTGRVIVVHTTARPRPGQSIGQVQEAYALRPSLPPAPF